MWFYWKTLNKKKEKRADNGDLLKHNWIGGHEKDEESVGKWLPFLFDYNYA